MRSSAVVINELSSLPTRLAPPHFVTVLSKRGSRNLCVCVRDSLFMDKVFFTLLRVFVGVARGQTQKKKGPKLFIQAVSSAGMNPAP